MEAVDYLRKLVSFGYSSGGTFFDVCRYCDADVGVTGDEHPHEPDCPWIAARSYLASVAPKPEGEEA